MGFRKVDYCHMQTFHFSLYFLCYLNYCKQMGNLSWPCFGQNPSLVHRICLLIYLVPFSFISFKQPSAYMIYIRDIYISTAWNIYITTSKLSVIEVDTNTIHKLIGYCYIQERKFPNSMAFEGRRVVVFGYFGYNK